ncbi:MAG: patatin-like phospholipase family protein [Hyphomicrobiaceae bacterium]
MNEALPPPQLPAKQPTIALALGGGGARGLAHILMIEALEELNIRPVVIAGTSIGAVFGAAYAAGLSAALIRAHTEETLGQRFEFARNLLNARADPVQKLFNFLPLRSALLKPAALLDLILPSRMPKDFSGLSIPLEVVATDFYAQTQVVLKEGLLAQAVAASIALPAIFQPVTLEGRQLMDGGLVNPLPFDLIAGRADITVAIDVSGAAREPDGAGGPRAMEAVFAATQILQRSIVREKLKSMRPDIYIDVDVYAFHALEFHKLKDVLAAAAPAKDALKRELGRVLGRAIIPAPAAQLDVAPPEPRQKRLKGLKLSLPKPRKRK